MRLPDAAPWSKAAAPIWALVSGLPGERRRKRPLFMFQAFIDESGERSHTSIFALAGYLAPAEQWAAFADEWQTILDMKPRLEYFKMNEAYRLKDQFWGWSEDQRNERLCLLYGVIERHVTAETSLIIDLKIHDEIFSNAANFLNVWNRKQMLNPYPFAVSSLIASIHKHRDFLHVTDRIEFIFDRKITDEDKIRKSLEEMELDEPTPYIVSTPPNFKNDIEFLPLQAADLIAWWARRRWEEKTLGVPRYEYPWVPSVAIQHMEIEWDEQSLRNAALAPLRYGGPVGFKYGSV